MKRILFSLAIVIAIISIVSCSNNNKKIVDEYSPEIPTLYYAGYDTTVSSSYNSFEKKNYTKTICATGKKVNGKYWALSGKDTIYLSVTKQGPEVPRDSVLAWFKGTTKIVSDGNGATTSSVNDWWWLPWILGLAALALLIWFIWWLFNQIPNRNNIDSSNKKDSVMSNNSAANPDRIAALTAMIATMKGTDGVGKGTVKDGNLEMVVGEAKASINIRIRNTGSGSVYVGDHMKVKLTNSGNIGCNPDESKKDVTAGAAGSS
ncbi:hypothetical protein IT402_00695 [Candidatus Nomurabacteria bacterium]|nr:hypothetical protein [Candidatus Nomurabacteria bacterium]